MITNIELERRDKRKSVTITIVVHALLFLLLLLPFIIPPVPDPFRDAIVIDFSEPSSSSSSSSSTASSSPGSRPKVAMARIEPSAARTSVDIPKSKPVITSPEPEIPVPPAQENYFDQPLDISENVEAEVVEELTEPTEQSEAAREFDEWAIEESEERTGEPAPLTGGTGGSGDGESQGSGYFDGEFDGDSETGDDPFADGFFDGDWPGGDGSEGKNLGVGQLGDGNYYGDFSGDGLFDRKVIKRANVGPLARKPGRLVIDLCVDADGRVYWAELNSEKSTIQDADLQKNAREVAMQYVYEPDAAKDKECGRLTFIFKID
jgi:hypothetical protein